MSDTVSDITDVLGCFTMWSAIENILFTDYSQDSYIRIIKFDKITQNYTRLHKYYTRKFSSG